MKTQLQNLPSVDALLSDPRLAPESAGLCREALAGLTRQVLSELRRGISSGGDCPSFDQIVSRLVGRANALGRGLRHVINATGVVLHTNLGRAPVSKATIEAMSRSSLGFVDLEMDLESGKRGSRQEYVEPVLCLLSGAEAGMVVNNNASAVLLGLTALARGKEVIVSRGQAVQIGGGVRIPDIMRQGGAKLVEVGTTNVTEVADYANAVTPRTAAFLRVHSSNFKIIGFTGAVSLGEMASLAQGSNALLLDDLGSGCLLDTRKYGLAYEPMVQESVAAGADLVFFSGDKLLGGPQAGLIVGKKALVDKLKKHPLARAVRIDRTRLGGIVATLMHYLRGDAEREIPVWRMIAMDLAEIERRACVYAKAVENATVERGESLVGGGSLPGSSLPTCLVVIRGTGARRSSELLELAARLRRGDPPVLCRIEKDRILLDPRTVQTDEDAALVAALARETSRTPHA